jgi:zinc transport system substrate-binding protein
VFFRPLPPSPVSSGLRVRHVLHLAGFLLAFALIPGCARDPELAKRSSPTPAPVPQPADAAPPAAPDAIGVCVPIVPLAYFVERLGGPHVRVTALVPPGQSMHAYDPTPRQIGALAEAAVYFSLELPFERRITAKIAADGAKTRVVNVRLGVNIRAIEADEAGDSDLHDHDHDAVDEHHHHHDHIAGEPDPHLWLSARVMQTVSKRMAAELSAADPAHASAYEANLATLLAELQTLDGELKQLLAPAKGRSIYVYHPTYGYFCDDYGLKQIAVEIAGRDPTARELNALIDSARRAGVRTIFVQPQFSRKSAEALAEQINGTVVSLDPLAADWMSNMRQIAQAIANAK